LNTALPITIIVDNFIKVAQEEQQTEQFKAELLAMEEQEKRSRVGLDDDDLMNLGVFSADHQVR
jgi:hypothetical protein